MEDMFKKATRIKLRFNSPKGSLMVEDLWDLPLSSNTNKANLDDIAKDLYSTLKDDSTLSFVTATKPKNEVAELAFEIVKHIIGVRLQENAAAAEARNRAEQKQKIMAIIDRKKDEQLEGKSLEELQAALATL